jgi:hypothetical protein
MVGSIEASLFSADDLAPGGNSTAYVTDAGPDPRPFGAAAHVTRSVRTGTPHSAGEAGRRCARDGSWAVARKQS